MPRRTSERSWDPQDFSLWLIAKGVSPRVASNYVSRCRRVEDKLNISLSAETISEKRFVVLMTRIQQYSSDVASTKESAYALTATLRLAARKFAQYWAGKKAHNYPNSHGLSDYR